MRAHAEYRVADSFWRFSLALYARPGVARSLIALQDGRGCDVNVILFALWAGAIGGVRLDTASLARAEAATAPLRRSLIEPLRRLRRRLKQSADPQAPAQRQRILAVELRAERQAQASLVRLVLPQPKSMEGDERAALARENLAAYLGEATDPANTETILAALRSVMRCAEQAAFPPTV